VISYSSKQWYEGQLYTVATPQLNIPRCQDCGELLFDNWADDQIDRAFRQQVHLLTPEQIRANRTALGLSPEEFAARLGVEENLLRQWEEDRAPQPRAMDNLIRVYFALPPVRSALNGKAHPELGTCVVS
jgi:DNA-binding transcriptional regulator YiaG